MKAAMYTQYGAPDVLQIKEIEKPAPADNEILVKVYTSTVSATDSHFRRADPFITRFINGLIRPNAIAGGVIAGDVEAVGKDVSKFKVGDQVVGTTMAGGNVEYICVPENAVVVKKGSNLSYEEAVGIPEALTPLYFLRDLANMHRGQKVLINGASGALGTFAIQLAKYYGGEVTGVCSSRNVELVKSLGADRVIDYTQEDFTQEHDNYDIIFDTVDKSSFSRCRPALKQGGMFLAVAMSPDILFHTLWTSRFSSKKAMVGFAGLNFEPKNLAFLMELAEESTIKSVTDRCYPLEEIVEAHRYVDTGRKRGNVVITTHRS